MTTTYVCPSCGHGAFAAGNCPICLRGRKYVKLRLIGQSGLIPMMSIPADATPRISIPEFYELENAMNGGFVPGSVTVAYGGAGIGKSTLCLKLVDRIHRIARAVYCSTEQSPEQIKLMGYRAGLAQSHMLIAYETHVEGIARLLSGDRIRFLVVDSLSNLSPADAIAGVTMNLVDLARSREVAMLLVLHETKAGDYNAPRQVEHLVDCMVKLSTQTDVEGQRALYWAITGKYRFGPIGPSRFAKFRYDEHGVPYPVHDRSA
jgi:predicted ATP-dependent serine protease